MEHIERLEADWPFLVTLLPEQRETHARELGALERKRGVSSAEALLRLAMVYGFCGKSLRQTVLWAREAGVAQLSAVALWRRLRNAADWLGWLVAAQLAKRVALPPSLPGDLRLRLVDATVVSKPGSTGTDYRVHLGLDLGRLLIDAVELTTAEGGETFKRLALTPGDVVMGDRGYAQRQGIAAVVAAQGAVLLRLNWHNVPLEALDGTRFDLWEALRSLAATQVGEWEVRTAPAREGTPAVPGRLVALRKSPAAAEAARRKVRKEARKKGKTPSERTLEAAGYVLVFTTLPGERLTAQQVVELYRFRWQIELTFKRMKSLVGLDELAAKDERLGRTFVLAKILGTLLVEELSHRWVDFSPWGYGSPTAAVDRAGLSSDGGDRAPGGGWSAHAGPVGRERVPSEPRLPGYTPQTPQSRSASPFPFLSSAPRLS